MYDEIILNKNRYNTDIVPMKVGHTLREPNELKVSNAHYSYYVIHCTVSGRGYFSLDGKTHTLEAGGIFIFPPHAKVCYFSDSEKNWEYYWIAVLGTSTRRLDGIPDFVCKTERSDIFVTLYERAKKGEGSIDYATSKIYELFDEIFVQKEEVQSAYVKKAMDYVGDRLTKKLNAGVVARYVGLTPGYLSKLMRVELGMPLKKYITLQKMYFARQELLNGKSVAETAESLGFCDQFQFSKMYKQCLGQSPSETVKKAKMTFDTK